MRVSKHVAEGLDVAGPFVDRLAAIAYAAEAGHITEREHVELRRLTRWEWSGELALRIREGASPS